MGEPAQAHEAAALDALRQLLPDSPTTHVWTNVLFRDRDGRAGEYDVILLHHNGLFVLELKGWHGRITGDQFTWTVTTPSGQVRQERDPFQSAELKAKRLASELQRTRQERRARHLLIPRIEAMTVLHGQGSRVELSEAAASRVWSLDGYDVRGVPSIRGLLDAPPLQEANSVDSPRARELVRLIEQLGLRERPRTRMVGQYAIERADPLGEGPGWVDVRATHPVMHRTFRRIRLYDVPAKANRQERSEIERAAYREMALVDGLGHPGIVRPLEILTPDSGPALVFPDDADTTPLTAFLAQQPRPADVRLNVVRQIGEVLDYAHKRGVQHRALTPSAVRITEVDGAVRVSIRDWQAGRRDQDGATQTTVYSGVTGIRDLVAADSWLYLAPEAHQPRPEGVGLDVYGLGSLAYLVLTGSPPATDFADLQQRLEQGGLDPRASDDGLSAELCDLVRRATHPDLAERLTSVAEFLDGLTAAAAAATEEPVEAADPRTADVGALIADRWEVTARLGSGGSGTALLVDDYLLERERLVLKVALDEHAADRLGEEAQVLRQLGHPRVVRLIDGPLDADGHQALLVEDAGRPTLGRRIVDQGRLTLEQLENYGRDLFEAVAHLESRGVFHRDIKPDNLGVREDRADRRRHLVLFDFSLSSEPLDRIRSGTHGYLDPFLGHDGRLQFDSAAERFAVAVTLFEMAAGVKPEWGDGRSNPALINDDVHLAESMFEPEIAQPLLAFFRCAFARDPGERFDSLEAMAQAWMAAFPSAATSVATDMSEQDRDAQAAAATLSTDLARAGLSAQAVSAARRLGAHTVGELVDASAFAINTLPGVGVRVRSELQLRRRAWRDRLASPSVVEQQMWQMLRGIEATQTALVPTSRAKAAPAARLAARLLNIDIAEDASPWPNVTTAAAQAGLQADPATHAALLASHWAASPTGKALLGDVTAALMALGGIATADEIAERLVALRGSDAEGATRRRNAVGLVRAAVEADAGATLAILRHGDAVLVTTTDAAAPDERLEAAAALASAVDEIVEATAQPLGQNVGYELVHTHPRTRQVEVADPQRVLVLAARASAHAAVSSRHELYPVSMDATAAMSAVLGFAPGRITAERLRALVGSRFPAAQPAPARPDLDHLVRASGAPLMWDTAEQAYVRPARSGSSLLSSGTLYTPGVASSSRDDTGEALQASLRSHSALVVTCPPHRLTIVPALLASRFGVQVVDVTARLIEAMRERANTAGVHWSLVLRADAAPVGSTDRANLERLVADATDGFWPTLLAEPQPLLLTDVAPLARYGQTARVAALLDTASARPAARWMLVPKRAGAAAPTLDGAALPVASGTWIDLGDTLRESA